MVEHLRSPAVIDVPGGKAIDEWLGRVRTGETRASVARMVAPPGWNEPAQTPEFDELTLVLRGTVTVEHDGGQVQVPAGEAVLTRAGERVRYSVAADAGETEYVAVCLPAFSPQAAHREE
jgi:mannose-6-phosphate isomerase-like protein (cupin superfamily)